MWLGFLAAALLFNFVLVFEGGRALAIALHEPIAQEQPGDLIEFEMVDESALEPDLESEGDFVEQHRSNSRPPPEDTRRLAEVDSDVERETKAPTQPDLDGAMPSRRGTQGGADQPKGDPQGQDQGDEAGEGQSAGKDGGEDGSGEQRLVEDRADASEASQGSGAAARRGVLDADTAKLAGSPGMLRDTFGPRGNQDVLRDVDEGVENILDSKKHRYASFFNRIRDRVAGHWSPSKVHDRYDPDRSKYGDKRRTTVLMVRLDSAGELVKVVIQSRSGAGHLDDEAVRAMKAAAPFPNPPEGLADPETGTIDFRFGFILEFDGSARIFRYSR